MWGTLCSMLSISTYIFTCHCRPIPGPKLVLTSNIFPLAWAFCPGWSYQDHPRVSTWNDQLYKQTKQTSRKRTSSQILISDRENSMGNIIAISHFHSSIHVLFLPCCFKLTTAKMETKKSLHDLVIKLIWSRSSSVVYVIYCLNYDFCEYVKFGSILLKTDILSITTS